MERLGNEERHALDLTGGALLDILAYVLCEFAPIETA